MPSHPHSFYQGGVPLEIFRLTGEGVERHIPTLSRSPGTGSGITIPPPSKPSPKGVAKFLPQGTVPWDPPTHSLGHRGGGGGAPALFPTLRGVPSPPPYSPGLNMETLCTGGLGTIDWGGVGVSPVGPPNSPTPLPSPRQPPRTQPPPPPYLEEGEGKGGYQPYPHRTPCIKGVGGLPGGRGQPIVPPPLQVLRPLRYLAPRSHTFAAALQGVLEAGVGGYLPPSPHHPPHPHIGSWFFLFYISGFHSEWWGVGK